MKKKLYLIGEIPIHIDKICETKFHRAKVSFSKLGFTVLNPLDRMRNRDLSREDVIKDNLRDLMFSDAVYIMPCLSLSEWRKNTELKWALDLKLTIISSMVDINPKKQQTIGKKAPRYDKKTVS